ncbi:hypothetical protein CAOG_06801 [Capsaspora owczarzaki ATCC 30864]|uniref:NOD3 protein n=1 Tax=Capsaspora owczarzaki (strain ATCC 30864) TaxID=595528 RepID=A0A0D2X4Q7_CAPO3|nr:hypothetical protein CAOG_06801 [Capsaspora owczarzaki ATCC 30864]KJE96479.1 hypothetical protein CAOG_006801 [Capsaspora owczarzaki ATCC 30864]|eukprot:XP_004344422.2 hypothetical protein CAOG_06801 [Capsaspora owczarzaki ATCC 30864]
MLSYERMNQRQRDLYDQVKNASGELSLDRKQMHQVAAKVIAEALKVNTTLTVLGLDGNQIGNVGARAIAEALKVNMGVTLLGLQQNQIGDAGAQAIAEALKVNTTLTQFYLGRNEIGDVGAQAIAEALKVNKTLTRLDFTKNYIGSVAAQALDEARRVNGTLTSLHIDNQINPLALSLLPRLATAEDLQTVFHLLIRGPELQDQSASLPALPAELAERILDEACYWQGVLQTMYTGGPIVTLPQGADGSSIRVKAIHALCDRSEGFDVTDNRVFELIVYDEQGNVQLESAVHPTLLDSTVEFVTLCPASTPIIRQMREEWQVQVRPSGSVYDLRMAWFYVGYVERL